VVRYWRGYVSGARCRWFAYDPADATATPSSLAPVKSRMVYPVLAYPGCPGKRPLNRCSSSTSLYKCGMSYVSKLIISSEDRNFFKALQTSLDLAVWAFCTNHLKLLNTCFMWIWTINWLQWHLTLKMLLQNTFTTADCFGVQPVVYKAYYCQC